MHQLGAFMVSEAREALQDADIILFMVEPQVPGAGDTFIINLLRQSEKACPVILVINKIDLIKKTDLLPVIDEYGKLYCFDSIVPLSAFNPDDLKILINMVEEKLPYGPQYYPDDVLTDQHERFVVAEIIREKIMEATKDEVPHSVAVEIVKWEEREDGLISVSVNIFVERQGQKGIIIGDGGKRLKAIGAAARAEIESFLGRRVFMELWVKVKEDWRSDERTLKELGLR
ncbi:MAG TPA: GTPase Era [Nitrospiraceae bacterium]|nr:GTPase Era [Nitrospiraceae bacterium]